MRADRHVGDDGHRPVQGRTEHHYHEAPNDVPAGKSREQLPRDGQGPQRHCRESPDSSSHRPAVVAMPQSAAVTTAATPPSASPCEGVGAAGNGGSSAQQQETTPTTCVLAAGEKSPSRHRSPERRSDRSAAAAMERGGRPPEALAGGSTPVACAAAAAASACSVGGAGPAGDDVLQATVVVAPAAVDVSSAQRWCGEQEQEETVFPTAGSAVACGACSGDAGMDGSGSSDVRGDGVGALAGTAAAEASCGEPTTPGEATATAAGAGKMAASRPEAVASTDTATAETSSVWDLESLDFEEEDDEGEEEDAGSKPEDAGSKDDGRREMESARQRCRQTERDEERHEQEEQRQEEEGQEASDKMGRVARSQEQEEATAPIASKQPTTPQHVGDGPDNRSARGAAVRCGVPAVQVVTTVPPCDRARELMPPPPPNITRAKMRRRRSRVTLMHSPRYQRLCGLLERHSRRDDLLYAMLGACDLPERLTIVAPARATDVHLRAYHNRDYVEALRNPPSDVKTLDEYGLLEDCEVFEELYAYCCAVAGASLHAADRLCRGEADVAINWGGGRHHAKKGEAAGFCYVNDGVLAVLHLAKAFGTVLTIDIDVHHGDGVQEAFYMSNTVMTMSFHHLAKGFFPGGGQCPETGAGNGRDFNLNIPLKEGCGDESFLRVFTSALTAVTEGFQPEAVVLLCGADTLSADPLGPFNLTSAGVRSCVELVAGLELPLLLLGGGGYCPTDTARLWTSLTAAAVGADAMAALPSTVPDHAYFPLYGPDFRMATREKTLQDENDDVFLARLCDFAGQAGRRVRAARKKRDRTSTGFRDFSYAGSSDSW